MIAHQRRIMTLPSGLGHSHLVFSLPPWRTLTAKDAREIFGELRSPNDPAVQNHDFEFEKTQEEEVEDEKTRICETS